MPVLGSRRLNQHGVPVQHTTWLEGATWLSRKTKMQSLIFYGWTNRSAGPGQPRKTGNWYGWPAKDIKPATLTDDAGRAVRIRAPVMDLEGLITPTNLHYTVQHFAVPPVVETDT